MISYSFMVSKTFGFMSQFKGILNCKVFKELYNIIIIISKWGGLRYKYLMIYYKNVYIYNGLIKLAKLLMTMLRLWLIVLRNNLILTDPSIIGLLMS